VLGKKEELGVEEHTIWLGTRRRMLKTNPMKKILNLKLGSCNGTISITTERGLVWLKGESTLQGVLRLLSHCIVL
jgi:hypothetical protein